MGRWVVSRSAVGEELALPYMQWVIVFALYLLAKSVTAPVSFTFFLYIQYNYIRVFLPINAQRYDKVTQ